MEPKELRCSACGAALHYESGRPVIVCSHCGTEFSIDEPTGEVYVEYMLEEAEAIPEIEAPEENLFGEDSRPVYEPIVLSMLRAGKRTPAVKLVRSETGLGLREAEELVDALAAREGIVVPASSNTAWVWVVFVIIFVALTGVLAAFILTQSW
jgi:DNA-directed RNA polymerase subunit RPC12/RpoP